MTRIGDLLTRSGLDFIYDPTGTRRAVGATVLSNGTPRVFFFTLEGDLLGVVYAAGPRRIGTNHLPTTFDVVPAFAQYGEKESYDSLDDVVSCCILIALGYNQTHI